MQISYPVSPQIGNESQGPDTGQIVLGGQSSCLILYPPLKKKPYFSMADFLVLLKLISKTESISELSLTLAMY